MKALWDRMQYEPALMFGLPTLLLTLALTFWPGHTWLAFLAACSAATGTWLTRSQVTPTRKLTHDD